MVNFNLNVSEEERHPFMVSLLVIILAILAIISFAVSGGSIMFYLFAILALAVGIYLAYVIPKEEAKKKQTKSARKS